MKQLTAVNRTSVNCDTENFNHSELTDYLLKNICIVLYRNFSVKNICIDIVNTDFQVNNSVLYHIGNIWKNFVSSEPSIDSDLSPVAFIFFKST